MKAALNAAKAGIALMAMSVAFSAAVIAAPDDNTSAPALTLLATDTADFYPFAAIEFQNQIYHVTVGDVLDGVYIDHITPGKVTLSTDQVLLAGQPLHPEAIPGDPDSQVARSVDR